MTTEHKDTRDIIVRLAGIAEFLHLNSYFREETIVRDAIAEMGRLYGRQLPKSMDGGKFRKAVNQQRITVAKLRKNLQEAELNLDTVIGLALDKIDKEHTP